jgi:hypothetical protein
MIQFEKELLSPHWTTEEAIELCKLIEPIAVQCKGHIGLTGGLLYKEGPRKDCDLVVYGIRQKEFLFGLFCAELEKVGVKFVQSFGFVTKFTYNSKSIDILYPEDNTSGDYPESCEDMSLL